MAKGNQKAHAEVVRGVLGEIATDRREAYAEVQRRVRALRAHIASVDADPEAQRIVQEAEAAEDDVKAHARYEGKTDAQAFGAEKARLDARLTTARAALVALQKREQERVAPLDEAVKAAQGKAVELDREWRGHLRVAKASGVDLKAYWTPESGIPAEAPPKASGSA